MAITIVSDTLAIASIKFNFRMKALATFKRRAQGV